MKNIIKIVYFAVFTLLLSGCAKDFLDKKPDKALVVPNTLKDLQALLDNSVGLMYKTSYLTHVVDGDFMVSNNGMPALAHEVANAYVWKKDIYEGAPSFDWNRIYQQIFYANVVLEGLERIERISSNGDEYDHIKGSALFFRAYAVSQLIQQFTEPYVKETANETLGVPIRKKSDVNIKSKRASLAETYAHIIKDLNESFELLKQNSSKKFRPSKVAAYALIARIYLIMDEYKEAKSFSDLALNIQSDLVNYNELDSVAKTPFPDGRKNYNKEIIYYTDRASSIFYQSLFVVVNPELFEEYHYNDLRKVVFYNENGTFKGSYSGIVNFPFTGLATDELYLIRAECNARTGKIAEAMADLNTLMQNRWKGGTSFSPYFASDETEALKIILEERRKELVARGLRWSDLRRLNKDPRFQVTLERSYDGKNYQLMPNDKRYVFQIAQDEIERSGIEQNKQ